MDEGDGADAIGTVSSSHVDAANIALAASLRSEVQQQMADLNRAQAGHRPKIGRPATLQDIRQFSLRDLDSQHMPRRYDGQHQYVSGNTQSGSKSHLASNTFSREASTNHLSRSGTLQSRWVCS